ncbi:DUF2059 domain-containing protein [Massilia putida]|uniref:DUF2059 domain-containing protein n=1 Tax=Massilia putida TaxID=1141883 RepID=UPI00095185BA|nr:DUF2059 domain-containing protein [Massilia putida]
MKKSLAAIASAIIVTCAPAAFAATPVPSADPAVVAATKQMMASMKLRDVMLASLKQADQQIPAQMAASLNAMIDGDATMSPDEKADARKKLEHALPTLTAEMHSTLTDPGLVDDMLAEMVPLYAETYTLNEIRQLSAFYASPLGQKMLANMPTLMSRSVEISNRLMVPRIQKMMAQSAQSIVGK